jgi:Holliday junction DNA helicase RuvB
MPEDILNPAVVAADDRAAEIRLRPERLAEFVGQGPVVEDLRLFITAARQRGEPLDHVLLFGPPGLGKTTLAAIVANEMGTRFHQTSGPVLERKDDLAAILTQLSEGDVLFIDEIHRLSRVVEECLYPALEDYRIDIILGEGPHANSVRLHLKRFTLVGATTRAGMLTGPLRARFGITERLNFYEAPDLERIATRSARILSVGLDGEGARQIAKRSRGTPRVANRLLRRVRDYAQVHHDNFVTGPVALEALEAFDVDGLGLDLLDRMYLRTIIDKFGGGPVGIKTLSVALGEDPDTIEDVVEPYLIQIGFLNRTPQGRVVTPAAAKHLKRKPPIEQREML